MQEDSYGVYADVAYYRQIIDININASTEAGKQLKDFPCHTAIKRLFIVGGTCDFPWVRLSTGCYM